MTPRTNCALPVADASLLRPLHGLSILEAHQRFGVPRQSLHQWRRRYPHIAVREPSARSPEGWRWVICPAALAMLLVDLGRLDVPGAARRFNVPLATFSDMHPGQIGVLIALLPWPERPPDRPPSPLAAPEAVHAAD